MAKTRGTGLLMVWADIDSEFEDEFNSWYDGEHIPRLLQVPGFLSAGRYTALQGAPRYLAIYELEEANVLLTAAYLDTVKYRPSAAREKTGTGRIGRNFLRNAYRQIFPVHTDPATQTAPLAPILQMGRIDVRPRSRRSSIPGTTRSISCDIAVLSHRIPAGFLSLRGVKRRSNLDPQSPTRAEIASLRSQ